MPTIEKGDIFQGSSLTVGRYTSRHRAVRRFYVTGLDDTEDTADDSDAQAKLAEAIATVDGLIGDTHPTHPSSLPVSHITARKWFDTTAFVTVYYAKRTTGGGSTPDTDEVLANYRTAFHSQRVYRGTKQTNKDGDEIVADTFVVDPATGLPAGDLLGYNTDDADPDTGVLGKENIKPDVEMWSRPVLVVQARTLLNSNIAGTAAPFNSYINSDNISGLGATYAAQTLRFDGVDVTEVKTGPTSYEYPTVIKFTAMALGLWWGQRLKAIPRGDGDYSFLKWGTDNFQLYPQTTFSDLFGDLFTSTGMPVRPNPRGGAYVTDLSPDVGGGGGGGGVTKSIQPPTPPLGGA
jgi:hypothetical protein